MTAVAATKNSRRLLTTSYLVCVLASLIAVAGIGGSLWFEAAEQQRVAAGMAENIQAGLVYATLSGIVPVFGWLAAGITAGILLGKWAKVRQEAGILGSGWGPKAGAALGQYFLLLVVGAVLVWLGWLVVEQVIESNYGVLFESGQMVRNAASVLSTVFGPGLTAGLPAVLLTVSSGGAEEDE